MSKELILKKIGAIGRAAAKLTKDVQGCAVECAWHAIQHGDVTLADQLVDAIGKQGRKASLRAWFERNTPMYIPKGKDKFAFDSERAKAFKAEGQQAYTERVAALPWEEAKPEAPVVSVFDVSEAVDKFMKRVQGMVNDANVTIRNKALLEELGQTVARYHMEQALSDKTEA